LSRDKSIVGAVRIAISSLESDKYISYTRSIVKSDSAPKNVFSIPERL